MPHFSRGELWCKKSFKLEKETSRLLEQVVGWQLANGSITKNFKFKDFKQAVKFVDAVAEIAEKDNHHPQILLWKMNNVKLTLKTYCINDLSKLDFSLAKKIDKMDLVGQPKQRLSG